MGSVRLQLVVARSARRIGKCRVTGESNVPKAGHRPESHSVVTAQARWVWQVSSCSASPRRASSPPSVG